MQLPATINDDRVNGISMKTFSATINAIREAPEMGNFRFCARSLWLDGMHSRAIVKDIHSAGRQQSSRATPIVVETDMPPLFDGHDRAASSLEQLLIALGSCVTTALVSQAAIRGIHIDALEIHSEGDIDMRGFLGIGGGKRRGFAEIRLDVQLEADICSQMLDKIVVLGVEYSPTFATIVPGTDIRVRRDGKVIF